MWDQLTSGEAWAVVSMAIANVVGALAALRAWAHSSQAKELVQETIDAITIDLREDLAEAVAEGASQIIAEVKAHAPKVLQ